MQRAVFLDRDGVLNRAIVRNGLPFPPRNVDELEILDEARLACETLRMAGFKLICVTNQPDISRGTSDAAVVAQINQIILSALRLDDLMICPHDDADGCDCRKPKPGMMIASAKQFDLSLKASFMIGDRWRDIEAGKAAGCRSVFINRGYAEKQPTTHDFSTQSVESAADWILQQNT